VTCRELARILDGAPARKSPDSIMASDAEILTTARAALDVTVAVLDGKAGGR
jgi:hypothetical protein